LQDDILRGISTIRGVKREKSFAILSGTSHVISIRQFLLRDPHGSHL